jgi:hypothetical protein
MHIKTFLLAKKRLEEKGKIVIGGYISPSSDQYVKVRYPFFLYLFLILKMKKGKTKRERNKITTQNKNVSAINNG